MKNERKPGLLLLVVNKIDVILGVIMTEWSSGRTTVLLLSLHFNLWFPLEFFLKGAELSVNSENQINQWSMYMAQFKDPVSQMCLIGAVVACWSLAQEVAGSSTFYHPQTKLLEGHVFTPVCHSVQGGACSAIHPGTRTPFGTRPLHPP